MLDHLAIDGVDLLSELSIDATPVGKGEILYSCPFKDGHAMGDATPSAHYNEDKRVYRCKACQAAGTVLDLVMRTLGLDHIAANRWLLERFAVEDRPLREGSVAKEMAHRLERWANQGDDVAIRRRPDGGWAGPEGTFGLDWRQVAVAHRMGMETAFGGYMLDRGFSAETLQGWDLGYDSWYDRITIPVHDEDGELVGFKGRAWQDEQRPKYLVLGDVEGHRMRHGVGFGFDPYEVGEVLFGLHRARDVGCLVLLEGELDCIALAQHGIAGGVSTGGSTITATHLRLLRWYASEVVIFYDSDPAGDHGMVEALEGLAGHMPVRVVREHEGDPASLSADECRDLIAGAVSWIEMLRGAVVTDLS